MPGVKATGCKLVLEPGRFIVGNAGILVSRVIYTKDSGGKHFVIQDAAMNDLIRPTLYDSFHRIWPVEPAAGFPAPPEDYEADIPGTERNDVVAVPLTSVIRAPYGDSVFVVEPKAAAAGEAGPEGAQPGALIARQQFVRVGPTRGDFVAILAGVDAGQQVVTAGAFKLRNQAPISIKNEVGTAAQLDPHPENR